MMGTIHSLSWWIGFHLLLGLYLVADTVMFHRHKQAIGWKRPLLWTGISLILALGFNVLVALDRGPEAGYQFLIGYLIEKSLSIDNLFIFLFIFTYFKVPEKERYWVLLWGIIGAMLLRIVLILSGIALIERFHWITYLLGVFLIITAIRFAFQNEKEKTGWFLEKIKAHFPKGAFVAIAVTDLIFALDSIPAIFAVTTDPFIVYTSNIFAVLGLRSLYFVVAPLMVHFRYFKYFLAAILLGAGLKLL